LLVQLDEPSLPAVLAGHLPTASGFDVLPAVEGHVALETLRSVLRSVGGDGVRVGVHCCASDVPIRLLTEAGAAFLGVDIGLLRARDDDPLGEAIDAGLGILLGAVRAEPEARGMSDVGRTVESVRSLWHRVGFGADRMREVAAVTPTCGLAGAQYAGARTAMRVCREAAKALSEEGS
jgi:methionine synthase II (cobalamin-independent)